MGFLLDHDSIYTLSMVFSESTSEGGQDIYFTDGTIVDVFVHPRTWTNEYWAKKNNEYTPLSRLLIPVGYSGTASIPNVYTCDEGISNREFSSGLFI